MLRMNWRHLDDVILIYPKGIAVCMLFQFFVKPVKSYPYAYYI